MAGHSLVGRKLGKYEVVEFVGQGGMASVFRGYQADIDRYVAIKVLPPHPGQDSQFVERFQQEAKTIARLQHPHILTIFDYGTTEDGIIYLVMPFMGGGSLRELMKDQPMNPQEVARILWGVSAALDYAHRQKIIHRDIKPDNILIDEDGNPLLSDFGIAKLLESNVQFTASGGFLGTPAYMAPEQGRGLANIDGRADIYALAVVVFEMLTGSHPYEAETPMMVMFKHVSDPVPSLRDVNSMFSAELDQVLQKALAKLPEDRYSSATAFAQAFQNAIGNTTDTPYIYRTRTAPVEQGEAATTYGSATEKIDADEPATVVMTSTAHTQAPSQETVLQGVLPQRRSNAVMVGVLVLGVLLLAALGLLFMNQSDEDDPDDVATSPTTFLETGELSAVVAVNSATILNAPDRNAEVLGRALEGESLRVLGQFVNARDERYYFVNVGGQEGWVVEQQLSIPAALNEIAPIITPAEVSAGEATEAAAPTESVPPSPSPSPIPTNGQLSFQSTESSGDTLALRLEDLSPLASGQRYHAWLLDTRSTSWLLLGELPVDVFGEGLISFSPETETPLYQQYDAIIISRESDAPGETPAEVAYSGMMLPAISDAIQQLFVAWTPEDAGLNPDALSLSAIAAQEYTNAADHTQFSLSAAQDNFPAGVRTHAEHVYNILHGSEEDINQDGSRGNNPSSLKIGLLPALEAINSLLIAATTVEAISPRLQAQVVNVQTCVQNARQWASESSGLAEDFSRADTVDVAATEAWQSTVQLIMDGQDRDENGSVEPIEGECGLAALPSFVSFISEISITEGVAPGLEEVLDAS